MKNEKEKKVDATNTKKIYVGEYKFMHSGKIEYFEYSKIFARLVCILIMHSPLIGHWSKEFQDDTGVPSSHGCKVIWSIGINNRGDKV